MRLEWLEDILAVHDTGSLRGAADIRFLTASAFTRRIKAVEQSIGSELFDRTNKPVTLRPHVIELIPRMREAAANLSSIQNELHGLGSTSQITRLICQHTLSISWAPKVAKALTTTGTQQRIRSGSKDECTLSILRNDTDFALVYEDPNQHDNSTEDLFDRIHFGEELFIPVAALKNNEKLSRSIQNKTFPLVSYPRNIFLGEVQEKALLKYHEGRGSFITIAEAGLGPAVMEFIREGLGIGWLPESLIKKEIESGEFTAMSNYMPTFSLEIVAITSKSTTSSMKSQIWKTIEAEFSSEKV